jgi:DNA polymerase
MFVGEAPGAEEDRRGEPFVGRAGQLLNEMLRAVGLSRENVFITNILKCRPPGNRDPRPEEAASCRGYLERQIELVSPTLIVAVGRIAAQRLLDSQDSVGRLRGRLHSLAPRGVPVLVTYHPAYLLRSPGEKRKSWADLLFAMQEYRRLELERGAVH